MVGICGDLGPDPRDAATLAAGVPTNDDEVVTRYDDDRASLWGSFHPLYAGDQPRAIDGGDALLWLWGDVYGHDDGRGYEPRADAPVDGAAYCADLYETHGIDFVEGLNGDFALAVLDRDAATLTFATDRVATRPIYYARPGGDRFAFASNVQALARHPDVDPAFDRDLLYEYLVLRRVFGVETPLVGVRELPPASIATVDLTDGSLSTRTYWRPQYRPVEKSADEIAAELRDTFRQVLAEWTDDDLDYGVLLSGGSDSRALLAGLDRSVDAYHVTDWRSRETRTAERVAAAADAEFHLLERGPEAEAAALAESPAMSNFSGWFDQAYVATFEEEIRSEVDVLLSGLYADMLFGGGPLRTHVLSLGPLGRLPLPARKPIDGVDEYVCARTSEAVEPVPYVADAPSIESVLADRIERRGDGVRSHGVRYESLADLVMYGDYYPMGADTDAIFSRSLMHLRPYRTPFLDNRLLDLQQQIPRRALLRGNLVHRVVSDLAPELAEIPHAKTGVPLKYPFAVEYLAGTANQFQWKHLGDDAPAPHLDHGPWPNRSELVRQGSFVPATLDRRADLLEGLPFLDADGAETCYQDHLAGADNTTLLYSLVTLLETPLARQVAAADSPAAARPGSPRT